MDTSQLVKNIKDHKITYNSSDSQEPAIEGCPFVCEFAHPINPLDFYHDISSDKDLNIILFKSKISDGYWLLLGNLLHVSNEDEVIDSSKISMEVCSEWCRIYIKEGCSVERAAEFIKQLEQKYEIEVVFSE